MDQSISKNTYAVKGKLEIIKFAYEKYDRVTSTSNALDRALDGATKVRSDALSCLQIVFPKHDRTTSTSNAMDRSFTDCQ